MKKMMTILAALLLVFTFALAEDVNGMIIGGADGPTAIILAPNSIIDTRPVTISLDDNPTTGYSWSGFVISGDSVVLSGEEGTYVADAASEELCGVGGKTYYTLIPVKPGNSIVLFSYYRPWELEAETKLVVLAAVDEDMNLFVSDITDSGTITGAVLSVNADEHSVMLNTETHGEINARFDADMELPVVDEWITIYTNGAMTMSIPAIVNVIAWETEPAEQARDMVSPFDMPELAINGGTLLCAAYHCSGDEYGNYFYAGIDWSEDGTPTLTVEERETYNDPLTVSRYAAFSDSMARIAALVNEYHMETWYERPDVVEVCDAAYPQLVLVIAFDNGDIVNESFSAYADYTDAEREAWEAVKNIVLEARSGEPFATYQIGNE